MSTDYSTWTRDELLEAQKILSDELAAGNFEHSLKAAVIDEEIVIQSKGTTSNPFGLLAKMRYERRKAACPGCAKGSHDEDCTNPDRVQPLKVEEAVHLAKAVGANPSETECLGCLNCPDPSCMECSKCRSWRAKDMFRIDDSGI